MCLALKQSRLNNWKINTKDPYTSLYLPFFPMKRISNENVFIPPDLAELLLASAFNFCVARGGVFH